MSDWLLDAPMSVPGKKADTPLHEFLIRLMRGENLSFADSARFFRALTALDANPAQIAGCLVSLASKGETYEELAGMARAMREQALPIKTHHSDFIDLAGTGSSPVKTFNISTAASFVAAGAGLAVAKHTSRGVTSRLGSADALNGLGINISGDPKLAQACLNGAGLAFLFAPTFHPTLRRVADMRRSLGIRTTLNLLGALSNPSAAPFQLLGVWHPSLVEPMAQALALLGIRKAWVVHGTDGLDEVTINGPTLVAEVGGNKIQTFEVTPQDFGLQGGDFSTIKASTAAESATIIREVLESRRRDEARSLVVANAAAALIIGGKSKNPLQAARMAEQSIDSGSARIKLDRLVQTTNKK
ncbi:MAG: anthranilate phosphoribosyltransferase [Acidobacteriota bacterium]|nr:anthranilate phosphoribosyltransferase [Acidobacteriota bacterium]MDH3531035.1 anthranilate phosphoribosyltransferase [Acidobacteriota bacterium]